MESDSDNESIEGDLDRHSKQGQHGDREAPASWGKAKFDYYFTDYVDKDYPSSLSRKEERLASIEQEEAQRIQKKLHSNLDEINLQAIIDLDETESAGAASSSTSKGDIIEFIEERNRLVVSSLQKKVRRTERRQIEEKDEEDDEDIEDDGDGEDDEDEDDSASQIREIEPANERKRRPINMAIKKNRGLTPYKKKEYRNPRVKHKLKYQKAMTKRRKLVKEAQTEFYRYSGESTGIKTSTIKSIKLY